jgi:hypothetical protein
MTDTNTDTFTQNISRIPAGRMPEAHPTGTAQGGRTGRRRGPMSQEQRRKLSLAQNAYIANDPRWAEHRKKLADAQIARRMTLTREELELVLAMRAKGRTFSYIQEEIGVCYDVIRRELHERGYSTARAPRERRVRRGKGFWRSFD